MAAQAFKNLLKSMKITQCKAGINPSRARAPLRKYTEICIDTLIHANIQQTPITIRSRRKNIFSLKLETILHFDYSFSLRSTDPLRHTEKGIENIQTYSGAANWRKQRSYPPNAKRKPSTH